MNIRPFATLLVFVLSLLVGGASVGRTWTDAAGELTVEAEFVTFQSELVWLHRKDGRVFGVPLDDLSQADRQFVGQEIARRAAQRKDTKNPPHRVPYGRGRRLAELAAEAIDEASGLACSRRHDGLFWTHNDSGGAARLYAFDVRGRDLGWCDLAGVTAFDWEDMASFTYREKPYLLLCDVGNNGRAAEVQILYLIEEPSIDLENGLAVKEVPVLETINFRYQDDHRDCEAVGVDPTDRTILLATKGRQASCFVYSLPWPEPNPRKVFVARRIATLSLPQTTAMDISPDGRRAVVLTYGDAFEYVRREGQDWATAFAGQPRRIVVPERVQGESLCFGSDGRTLYLTSEKRPTPLFEVPVLERP